MEFTIPNWSAEDEKWMRRCLILAEKGKYQVGSNPMVGCVLVGGGQWISEGYHKRFGEAHAEVDAWKNAGQPDSFEQGTIYVSLEPCSHHGKTPPCTDLLLRLRPSRVVLASTDPDVRVSGNGIRRLSEAGIKVDVGCRDAENRHLNRHYFTQRTHNRPFVALKWAETCDGMVGKSQASPESRLMISGPQALVYGHRLRAEHQSILVGGGTVLADNPQLNLRYFSGKSPQILVWWTRSSPHGNYRFQSNAHFTEITAASLKQAWPEITASAGNSVLVEGGAKTQSAFIEMGMWDEIHRIVNQEPHKGGGISAPRLPNNAELIKTLPIGNDTVHIYRPKKQIL
jgi:diaminohydroxyphosphoribosylaminopyrimidine deaminase/5-amino-6-(5-phosphoribosylamino)uracil reductase